MPWVSDCTAVVTIEPAICQSSATTPHGRECPPGVASIGGAALWLGARSTVCLTSLVVQRSKCWSG
eukprot:6796567-Pyramimonas_sp.AAC.1